MICSSKNNYKFTFLNLGNLICCLGLSLISPFYPTYAEKFQISETILGFIFAINPIGGMIASLIIGKILTKERQTKILSLGMFIQAIGLFQYCLLVIIQNKTLFIIISLLGRFISGFGASTYMTPFYASISESFPNQVDQKMAIAEIVSSIGYMSGPVVGSALYLIGGFQFPFLFFSILSFLISIILKFTIHNLNDCYEIDLIKKIDIDDDLKIGYWKLIKMFPIFSSFQITMAICILYTYYSPTYAIYMQEILNVSPQNIGFYMSITSFAYAIGAVAIYFVKIEREYLIIFGTMISGISQFFMGPDSFTGLQPNVYLTMSTQFTYGFLTAFPYILILPYITDVIQNNFEKFQHNQCICLSSGLYNAFIALGEIIGPIFSGLVTENVNFQRSCSILGIFLIISAIVFIPNLYKEKIDEKNEITICSSGQQL